MRNPNLLVMEDEVRLVPEDWAKRCECIHGVDLASCCCLDCREATEGLILLDLPEPLNRQALYPASDGWAA